VLVNEMFRAQREKG